MIELNNILDALPYRFPYLLVDKILDVDLKKRIVTLKNVSINEPYFQGHFPDHPRMPGALIVESMIQSSAALLLKDPEFTGRLAAVTGIDNVTFNRTVLPGDQLRLEMDVQKIKDDAIAMKGLVLVEGKVVCEGLLEFALHAAPSKPQIHPTASVHTSAILGKDVVVGPYTVIGENVIIGDKTKIEAHVMIEKWTKLGDNCHIHFGAVIGSDAQDIKYQGEKTWVVVGHNTTLREYVTVNRSTGPNTTTEIGSDCLLLTNVHVGHNCMLGNGVIIANLTNLGGHTVVEDDATIGGMTGVHQFCRIGKGAMVGAYTRLSQDVPPFMLCEGNPAAVRGINAIGLKRRGADRKAVSEIKDIYKTLYRADLNTRQALEEIMKVESTQDETQHLKGFLQTESNRGLVKKNGNSASTS